MNIASIKNIFLRRLAILAYLPVCAVAVICLTACGMIVEGARGAADAHRDTAGKVRAIRSDFVKCWRGG